MKQMKRCKICGMSNQRPGIKFRDNDVCYPCINFEKYQNNDWNERWNQLEILCDKYRSNEGNYDCIATVSGGKDSTYQIGLIKETLGMNPLCFMIDNGEGWTKTGRRNFYNLSERFDVNILTYTPSVKKMKDMTRKGFFEKLWPEEHWDSILYEIPMEYAQKLGIKLIFWGEDTSFMTGGAEWQESPNALKQSSPEVRERFKDLDVIFLSYYVPWSRYKNLEYAKKNGFKGLDDTNEWDREGLEGYPFEQVDTVSYLLNQVFKYIKFGFSNQTELGADAIRQGIKTREQVLKDIEKYEWKIDPIMIEDFLKSLNISEEDFWKTIDKFANKELLFKDDDGFWKLKKDYLK